MAAVGRGEWGAWRPEPRVFFPFIQHAPELPQDLESTAQLEKNSHPAIVATEMLPFRIRKGITCNESGIKKGPMVAKHPPLAAVSPSTPVLTDHIPEPVKVVAPPSRCRTPPVPRCRTPPPIPGPGTIEGMRPRKRSPSITRSRPSSPGCGATRRMPSPGALDPSVLEAVKMRVRRVAQARLYLLQQPGPNSFLVGGDSPEHKYRVVIGPQTCSCGRGPHCLHLLFVMLRVFQVPESDSRIYMKELKNFEVESLFQTYQERRSSRVSGSPEIFRKASSLHRSSTDTPPASMVDSHTRTEAASTVPTNNAVEEELCPICLLEMVDGESLVSCKTGCRNKLHHHCMDIWATECRHQSGRVLCPLCRRPWHEEPPPPRSIPSNTASDPAKRKAMGSPLATPKLRSPSSAYLPSFPGSVSPLGPRKSYNRYVPANQPPPLTPKPSKKLHPSPVSRPEHKPGVEHRRYGTPSPGSTSPMLGYRSFPSAHKATHSSSNSHVLQESLLPHVGSIPVEQMPIASEWIKVFGLDIVSCLYSRDWKARELALRRLIEDLATIHQSDDEQQQHMVIQCCAKILTMVANDPIFKVYLGCVRCFRVLLSYISCRQQSGPSDFRDLIRPIVRILLLKCADRHRNTSALSIEVLVELAKGQSGELALGHNVVAMAGIATLTPFLDGLELVLGCVLEEWCYESTGWQWLAGRLVILDRLVRDFPNEFGLQYVPLCPNESGYELRNYNRLMLVIEFALKALRSTHGTVSKLARHVFVVSASMAGVEHGVFAQVLDMLAGLDPPLQARLKKRLQLATDNQASSPAAAITTTTAARQKAGRVVATLNQPGITERRYCKVEPRTQCSACGHAKPVEHSKPVVALNANRSPPSSPAVRPRELDFANSRSKKPVKFQQLPGIITTVPPAKRWGGSGSRLYNLFTRNKKLEEVLPSKPEMCPLPSKSTDRVETNSTCSFNDGPSPSDGGSWPTTPGQEALSDYVEEDYAEELIVPVCVEGLSSPIDWDLPLIPGLQSPGELQLLDIHSHEQNMESGLKSSLYSEGLDWKRGDPLGSGAFSTCYQARDVTTGTLMAVKQMAFCRNTPEEQAMVEASIRAEIVMMRKLRHPNVVRILGASKQGSHFNLFVEWMAGGSVAGMLNKYGPFNDDVIVSYTKQILGGLAYLHDNHILHRDLKGANLLVDSTGKHLRIGDFGASARLISHATSAGEFQGQLVGTFAFMAPEVLRGEGYGRSCDIWSVGCCMIEMASTKPPWSCLSNPWALVYKIASSVDPPNVPSSMGWAMKDLALHCLRVNAKLRPSAKQLLLHCCFRDM